MNTDKQVTVSIIPPDSLLLSMAIRSDACLAIPGYYDFFGAGEHEKRITSTMMAMRQLHEEVVGKVYYQDGLESPSLMNIVSIKSPEVRNASSAPILKPEEIAECIGSVCSSLCDSDEPCSLNATGECYLRKNRAAPPGLQEWQLKSMQSLAKQLRVRGDDLSTDAASWLEMFSGQHSEAKS